MEETDSTGTAFQTVPLTEARVFTNREIPEFLNQERGLQMKKCWENINSVGGVDDLIREVSPSLKNQTIAQVFAEPNGRGHAELDHIPPGLQDLLGLDGRIGCDFDVFKVETGDYFGTLIFRSTKSEGEALVTKEVEVELKINRPYLLSYKEYAVVDPYEAERTIKFNRADKEDYIQYWLSDHRFTRFPSESEVDIWTTGLERDKSISVHDMSSQGWIHETRQGEREMGVDFNGDEPEYFDRLVPTMGRDERDPYTVYAVKTFTPEIKYFSRLFPKDKTLY